MWGDGFGWWGIVMMITVLALLVVVVWAVVQRTSASGPRRGRDAADILGERFARGEIDAEEYERRLDVLHRHG